MCGISGLSFNCSNDVKRALIEEMIKVIKYRGPDDQGIYLDDKIALGHVRLSIIDLSSGGHQPRISYDNDWVIVFNGEIYNYRIIREELIHLGYNFESNSDTEVILKGFIHWNEDLFPKLNGIFAFSIWQVSTSTLWIVRDRFGVKPLYYYWEDGRLAFASEMKSILILPWVSKNISYHAFHEFIYYGNPIGEKTLFRDIKKVKPGSFLKIQIRNRTFDEKYFWQTIYSGNKDPLPNVVQNLKTLLENAVNLQLVSDVPVGIFLSGGIDSTCITALASKHYNGKLATYTAAFDFDNGINELKQAKKIANHFGTTHNELFIKAKILPDIIRKLVFHHDEPFSDAANIPLFLLTEAIKGKSKVILQGDGGDELFGGYRRYSLLANLNYYKTIFRIIKFLGVFSVKSKFVKRLERMSSAIVENDAGKRMALLLTVEKENGPEKTMNDWVKAHLDKSDPFFVFKILNQKYSYLDLVNRMLWTDMQVILPNTFLEKVDKSTMANSVEVRVPFLENELANYVMNLDSKDKVNNNHRKIILKEALKGIVPDFVLNSPKTGFGVPFGNWIKGPLWVLLNDSVDSKFMKESGIFNKKSLSLLISDFKNGKNNCDFLLWKLMNFSIWAEMFNIQFN